MARYSLEDVYGLGERPKIDCPTYIDRTAHEEFQYTINFEEDNHIIVFGSSRQGKTWLVEKYCPEFIRIGCDLKHTREMIFKSILDELDIVVGNQKNIETYRHGGTIETSAKGNLQIPLLASGELNLTGSIADGKENTIEKEYSSIDLGNQSEVIKAVKSQVGNKFLLIENFHYLNIETQRNVASSLREFRYHGIRVIIVGVWKEITSIVSYISDLSDRCTYIDIGDWNTTEMRRIVEQGNEALNISIDPGIIDLFIDHAGCNVGIFKSLMKNYCFKNKVFYTQDHQIELNDDRLAQEAIDKSYKEVIIPAIQRLENLATSKKTGSKGMRYFILKSILEIMDERDIYELQEGIDFDCIVEQINNSGHRFETSNIKQELMQLHLREETVIMNDDANNNIIPLFFFDRGKGNGKLYIVESALVAAVRHSKGNIKDYLGHVSKYVK